jgi:RNA polymerase sigma-70 factor (sigma-E family)
LSGFRGRENDVGQEWHTITRAKEPPARPRALILQINAEQLHAPTVVVRIRNTQNAPGPRVKVERKGARVTFEEFVRAQHQAFLRYAVVLTSDPDLAQDLVQDVLIRVHRRWRRVQTYERPEQYVRRAIVNAYVSWRRTWTVRNLVPFGSPPDRPAPEPPGSESSDLWERMARLPHRQRAAVVLRYYEGLTDAEIAEVLGCTAATVRSHVSKALAALRSDIGPQRVQETL